VKWRLSDQRLAARVVRGNLLVAAVTALSLAAAATVAAHLIWQARESLRVTGTARLMAEAIRNEAQDEGHDIGRAAADVFIESALPGYRFEAWRGHLLVATNGSGPALGPATDRPSSDGWIAAALPVDAAFTVVVGTRRENGWQALSVFATSLAATAPVCLALAWMIGRHVAKAITRPLEDLRDRLLAARPNGVFPRSADADPPLEVREIDAALHDLWNRLASALDRETEFAANASHELRTPLTRIRLHIEQAASQGTPAERDDLGNARREIDRIARLVDSLLVLARDVSAGVPREVVNVADVCRHAAHRVFAEGATLTISAPDEAIVCGDEDLIDVAVENLLDNARKFSAPGTAVAVELTHSDQWVTLGIRSPGARVNDSERERVFERFYRGREARPSVDGHGLGLSLCRHIARLHGGEARCVSGTDEDACFVLELPSWKPAAGPGPQAAS
jgi:signal transduction histidine kinase